VIQVIDPSSVIKGVKEVGEIVKKYNDVPLYEKIITFQAQLVELAEERMELTAKVRDLSEKLEKKAKTRFENPYFCEEGNEVPLCPKCFSNSDGKLRMYLTHPAEDRPAGHGRWCRQCHEFYREGPRKTPVERVRVGRNYATSWML
jgi:hypothetical protein